MQQLVAQDAQYVFMEDAGVVANITGAYVCDQSTAPGALVRFKDILATVEKRLQHAPFFRRRLMRTPMDIDFPYWVDDRHFDIEYHVHHSRLPAPFDWRQFCIFLARYHSRPLDMGRPLWHICILEGLDDIDRFPKGSFALIVKAHHSLVDGTSGLQMLGALTDLAPEGPPAFRYPFRAEQRGELAPPEIFARAAINNFRAPWRLAEAAARASPLIARAIGEARRRGADGGGAPPSPFNAEVSPHKSFDAAEFSLDEFKAIRSSYPEAKVNDIVLTICGGGVRRYLAAKDALPKRSLIAMAPINARASGDGRKNQSGNNITAMTVPLFTQIAHPVERLKAITLATRRSKAAQDGVGARLMTDLARHAPASIMALSSRFVIRALAEDGGAMNNLIVSNVPGPQTPLYFCGAKLTAMYAMAPLADGMGLFIATPSYDGKIAFSITSTREIIPDTPFFMQCLHESFDELKSAAMRRNRACAPTVEETIKGKMKKKSGSGADKGANGAALR